MSLETFILQNFNHLYSLVCYFVGDWGGELNMRILRIQNRVIRSMVGVSSRTSCRHLLKELNILTLALLCILEVI